MVVLRCISQHLSSTVHDKVKEECNQLWKLILNSHSTAVDNGSLWQTFRWWFLATVSNRIDEKRRKIIHFIFQVSWIVIIRDMVNLCSWSGRLSRRMIALETSLIRKRGLVVRYTGERSKTFVGSDQHSGRWIRHQTYKSIPFSNCFASPSCSSRNLCVFAMHPRFTFYSVVSHIDRDNKLIFGARALGRGCWLDKTLIPKWVPSEALDFAAESFVTFHKRSLQRSLKKTACDSS